MSRPAASWAGLAIATAFAVVLPARASAREWTVGGASADFPFIGPAIAAAADGDVIYVRAGLYREDLVLDKRVALIGVGRPLIFGTGAGTVIEVRAAGCRIEGFAIEGSGTGISNAMDAAVLVLSNDNRIAGNRIRRVFYGIVLSGASNNEVGDNDITGLTERPFGQRGDGIYLYRAVGNRLHRNRVTGMRDAIYFQYAPRGSAEDNIVEDSRYGLHDMFSDGTAIRRNTFRACSVGANLMNSRAIELTDNRFEQNRGISTSVGLAFKQCDGSRIAGNVFTDNARALQLDGSSENVFSANRFRGNDSAVVLFSSAERNVFTRNEFAGNWSDVLIRGRDAGTRWSLDGVGNRWSGYRGFDFDGDGVGDRPHPILGPFEKIESANPLARLFLQSPAAAALALAARLEARSDDEVSDAAPLASAAPHVNVTPVVATAIALGALVTARRSGKRRG